MITLDNKTDKELKDKIYRTYVDQSRKITYNCLRNFEASEDATQEVFIKLFTNKYVFETERNLSKWISVASGQKAIDSIRASTRRGNSKILSVEQLLENKLLEFVDPNCEEMPSLAMSSVGHAIHFSFQFLSEKHQRIILDKTENELTYTEILQVNPNIANRSTGYRLYSDAIAELQRILSFFFTIDLNTDSVVKKGSLETFTQPLPASLRVKGKPSKRPSKNIPVETYKEVVELYAGGKTQMQIAEIVKLSQTQVSRIIIHNRNEKLAETKT